MQTTFQLPPKTTKLLKTLCDDSDKMLGLTDEKTFERLCKLVVVAHKESAVLTHEVLYAYLKDNGWAHEQADAVAKRYKAACYLLDLYDQYVTQKIDL